MRKWSNWCACGNCRLRMKATAKRNKKLFIWGAFAEWNTMNIQRRNEINYSRPRLKWARFAFRSSNCRFITELFWLFSLIHQKFPLERVNEINSVNGWRKTGENSWPILTKSNISSFGWVCNEDYPNFQCFRELKSCLGRHISNFVVWLKENK